MKIISYVAILCGLVGCSSANLQEVKAAACDKWQSVGYECIGYEGFQWGFWGAFGYGGAHVWHALKREKAPGIIYSGSIQKWGDELHVYGPKAIDAIKGQ